MWKIPTENSLQKNSLYIFPNISPHIILPHPHSSWTIPQMSAELRVLMTNRLDESRPNTWVFVNL